MQDKDEEAKGDYRKVKDKNGETGRGRKTCKFREMLGLYNIPLVILYNYIC